MGGETERWTVGAGVGQQVDRRADGRVGGREVDKWEH